MNFKNSVLGAAIGDALGVPFDFRQRGTFECTDMVGFGSWNKPAGTYSDDTAMTLCSLEVIANGYSKDALVQSFISWYKEGLWSIDNDTFDIGMTTESALRCHINNCPVLNDVGTNGNGSLMRIVPLSYWLNSFSKDQRYALVSEISSITHPHEISVNACIFITDVAINLINGMSVKDSINSCGNKITFEKLQNTDIDNIKSNGFVLNTLFASLWVLATTNNYKDAVLKAVNLGSDTDTTACVVGGLAGIIYDIPENWIKKLRGKKDILKLISRFD